MSKKKSEKKDSKDYECCDGDKCCGCKCNSKIKSSCGGIYWLGFIGSAIYYVSTSNSFWMGVLGLLKACVWPAFLVYESLKFFVA